EQLVEASLVRVLLGQVASDTRHRVSTRLRKALHLTKLARRVGADHEQPRRGAVEALDERLRQEQQGHGIARECLERAVGHETELVEQRALPDWAEACAA